MRQDKLVKIFVAFGDKWVKVEESSDTEYTKKRKLQLIRWIVKKLFLKH